MSSPNKIQLTNTLDFSWSIDSVERFLHGYIAGRDFIFTYGPLYQLIQSMPALLFHVPSYTSVLIAPLLLTALNCLCIFYLTNFITDKKGKLLLRGLLIFLITFTVFPDPNNLLRILLPLVYTLMYAHTSSSLRLFFAKPRLTRSFPRRRESRHFRLKILPVLALPAIFGLYSFDLFITCMIITLFVFCYDTYKTLTKPKKTNVIPDKTNVIPDLIRDQKKIYSNLYSLDSCK